MAFNGLFPETRDEAIVRTIGFRRTSHRQVIAFDAEHLEHWQASVSLSCGSKSVARPFSPLGALQVLPTEIMRAIVKELTIESALNFLRVNRLAQQHVRGLRQCRLTLEHAPAAVLAMVRTGLAGSSSFDDLYAAMCRQTCEYCRDGVGRYLYLPTIKKVCERCLVKSRVCRAVQWRVFSRGCLRVQQIRGRQLLVVTSIPGEYNGCVEPRAVELVNCPEDVRMSYHSCYPMDAVARHMVAVPMPILDPSTEEVVPVLGCKGCSMSGQHARDYVKSTLVAHLSSCEQGSWIWDESEQGTRFVGFLDTDFTNMDARLAVSPVRETILEVERRRGGAVRPMRRLLSAGSGSNPS